jgi:ABC-2 type transport system permease protein
VFLPIAVSIVSGDSVAGEANLGPGCDTSWYDRLAAAVSAIHPWLLTHNWLSFTDLLRTNIVWDGIVRNLSLQLLYVVVFGSAAWARFATKDVLA